MTRCLDWNKHPTLTDNLFLLVNLPSEVDEQAWISIGYAALFGALSAISRGTVSRRRQAMGCRTMRGLESRLGPLSWFPSFSVLSGHTKRRCIPDPRDVAVCSCAICSPEVQS